MLPSPNCRSPTTHDDLPRFVTVSDVVAFLNTVNHDGFVDELALGDLAWLLVGHGRPPATLGL